jgi:opacity protein-like surface antigen
VRAGGGWWNPAFSVGAVDSLMQVPITFDANYNWERGKWHPFAGAGLGVHFLQFRSELPSTDNTETKVGFNTGGGIEYFLNRALAVKGEGRYHALADARGEQTSGTSIAVGIKTSAWMFGSWILTWESTESLFWIVMHPMNTADHFLCIIQATHDASGRSGP